MGGRWCAFEGSRAAASFNLANVAIGGGLLSFPYVILETGVVLGAVLGLALAALMALTAEMVADVTENARKRVEEGTAGDMLESGGETWEPEEELEGVPAEAPKKAALTYEKVVELEFGQLAGVAAVLCIILNVFAAQVAPFIVIGDMLEPLLEVVLPAEYVDEWWASRTFVTAALGLLVMLPLSCTRQIDHLRFTSMLSILSITFAACVVVYNSAAFRLSDTYANSESSEMTARGDLSLAEWDWSIFEAIPIITYALSCHIQIPVIYCEMRSPSPRAFRQVAAATFATCLAVYYLAGEFGYLQFGQATDGNVLQNYPSDDLLTNVARVAVTVTLLFSYPLMSFVNRNALDFVIVALLFRFSRSPGDSEGEVTATLVPKAGVWYWARVLAVSAAMMVLAWTISVLVPEIQTVFGLTGAVVTTVTTFLIPPLMYWRLHRASPLRGWVIPLAIVAVGSAVGVLGAYFTILDLLS